MILLELGLLKYLEY